MAFVETLLVTESPLTEDADITNVELRITELGGNGVGSLALMYINEAPLPWHSSLYSQIELRHRGWGEADAATWINNGEGY